MARVDIKEPREQEAHFGLYRTSAGGDEAIIVRRKVGEPTDYQHTKSRKLKRERDNLALASQIYARLSPSQKAITRHEFAEVEYINSHGKTETKLLMGRQLFISRQIHSLNATGKPILVPHEVCILLTDQNKSPLAGDLWLRYPKDGSWYVVPKDELVTANWLFTGIPRGKSAYRVYGEAENFEDPDAPDGKVLSEAELLVYHHHKLTSLLETFCYVRVPYPTVGTRRGGFKQAQLFKPTVPFVLRRLEITLRRHYPADGTWPEYAFVDIHRVGEGHVIIEPPLRHIEFTLTMPPFPEWQIHSIDMRNMALAKDHEYAWVFGVPPPYYFDKAVSYLCGSTGTCWVYGAITHAWSNWLVTEWSEWHYFQTAYMCYEMKAMP